MPDNHDDETFVMTGTSALESETFKRYDSQGNVAEQIDCVYEEETVGSTKFVRRIK